MIFQQSTHGDVLRYRYAAGQTMGGVVMYEEVFNYKSPNKKLSFDFYVYDNTIPYEIRLMCCQGLISNTAYIAQFNINYSAGTITEPNTNAIIGVMDAGQVSGAEKATVEVTNRQWHKLEAIISAEEVDFYVDGAYLGTSVVPAATVALPYNSFAGVQVVSRANYQASTVTADSGLYLDNIQIYAYDENAAFYGKAETEGSDIVVSLSESVLASAPQNLSSIMVYNTRTGGEAVIGTPVLRNWDTIVIPVTSELTAGDEYLIQLPAGLTGISQKTVHQNCYFTVGSDSGASQTYLDESFTAYGTLTQNDTDVRTPGPQWFTANQINIKDSGDAEHGNVLYFASATTAQTIRGGVKNGGDVIDVTKGEATVEFDLKLINNDYNEIYIQPYSAIEGVDDNQLVNADVYNSVVVNNASQFCSISISQATQDGGAPWIQMRRTSNAVVAAQNKGNGNYGEVDMSLGTWHRIKITIDYSQGDYPTVRAYIDDALIAQSAADLRGAQASNDLRGIRFTVKTPAIAEAHDFIQIDNVKFTGPVSTAAVSKMRMFNIDGEDFGPIATEGLKASADKAEIYFTETVDVSNASVYLAGGSADVLGTLSAFDGVNNKVTVTFNDVLEKNTTYALTVTGVRTESGEAVPDSAAAFTTNGEAEFIVAGLKIADASGNELTDASGIGAGNTVYTNVKIINTLDEARTALVITAAYNDLAMTNVNSAEYDLPAGSKIVVTTQVPIVINSIADLAVKGYVWEGFDTNRPLADMAVCD